MTPCFACGLVMTGADLYVAVSHGGLLPGRAAERMTFHAECARRAPPRASTWTTCAMCGGALDPRLARETARWLVDRARGIDRERTVALAPAGLRFVDPGADFLGGRLPALTALVGDPLLEGPDVAVERILRPYFEVCHKECARRG